MLVILIGILSSVASEVVTALNNKLKGTVLQGDAAFIIAGGISILGAAFKVFYFDGVPLPSANDLSAWKAVAPAFTEVWTVSQLFFTLVTSKLGLDVQVPAKAPVAPTA